MTMTESTMIDGLSPKELAEECLNWHRRWLEVCAQANAAEDERDALKKKLSEAGRVVRACELCGKKIHNWRACPCCKHETVCCKEHGGDPAAVEAMVRHIEQVHGR